MKRLPFVRFMILCLLLTACGAQSTEINPPEIVYGQDVCEACGMIIDDARFAAATLLTNDETRKFDDLGEMFGYHTKHTDLQVRAWFVHDYTSQRWVRGETAYYVVNVEVTSPMDKGIIAFAQRAEAANYANEHNAKILSFEDIRAQDMTNRSADAMKSH
jgi:copper chaperone NosL